MKRRTFLKMVVTVFVACVPGAAAALSHLAGEAPPRTVSELIAWFERTFECKIGAPWTYVEPHPKELDDIVLIVDKAHERLVENMTPYFTYRFYSFDADEADLVRTFWRGMQDLLADYPVRGAELFWRLPEKITLKRSEIRDLGETIPAGEAVYDDDKDGYYTKSGLELVRVLPNEAQEDEPLRRITKNGFYEELLEQRSETFYLVRRRVRLDIRARIAIPALHKAGGMYWTTEEGAPTERLEHERAAAA